MSADEPPTVPTRTRPVDATRERILDAVIEAASIHGIARLSVSDVAHRAGLSRPTLYKHFASKDELVSAAVQREAERFVAQVVAVTERGLPPREGVEAAVLVALQQTRRHPLLDRIVRTEPETLVPLLTSDTGAVMLLVRHTAEAIISNTMPGLAPVGTRRFADVITRLLISYAISAPDDPPEVVAHAVASILIDGALASSTREGP
ncbi:MAG: TetR/AcrR family transcriptional regulator [Acidimicrobiia bacterium]